MNYDPSSQDALFSRILSRLDEQDRTAAVARSDMVARLERIEVQALKTNGRVTAIETDRAVKHAAHRASTAAYAASISLAVSIMAALAKVFFTKN